MAESQQENDKQENGQLESKNVQGLTDAQKNDLRAPKSDRAVKLVSWLALFMALFSLGLAAYPFANGFMVSGAEQDKVAALQEHMQNEFSQLKTQLNQDQKNISQLQASINELSNLKLSTEQRLNNYAQVPEDLVKRIATLEEQRSENPVVTEQGIAQVKADLANANMTIAAMQERIASLLDGANSAMNDDAATRAQLVSYMQLRDKVQSSAPFAEDLQQLVSLTEGNADIANIVTELGNIPHSGAPTLPLLQSRFAVMARPAMQQAEIDAAQNWWQRIVAHMGEIITVRKVNEQSSTGALRIIHDAEAALQRGDITGSVVLVQSLPENIKQNFKEWLLDAQARIMANQALTQISMAMGKAADAKKAAAVPASQNQPEIPDGALRSQSSAPASTLNQNTTPAGQEQGAQ